MISLVLIGTIPQTSKVVLPKRNPYLFSLPATITESKSDKLKYYLAGVFLSLNKGQSLGLNGSGTILPEVQNSLSEADPVIQSGEHIIRLCEMNSENLWLSDEIMERVYRKFLEVGKTKGLFSLDDPQQPKIVVISAHALQLVAGLRFLVKDEEGNSKLTLWPEADRHTKIRSFFSEKEHTNFAFSSKILIHKII